MRIDDVSLTLFAWEGIPPARYAAGLSNTSGRSELGWLRIRTDAGVEGHAFLGSPMRSATFDAKPLIDGLKPMLMGQDPLRRDLLHHRMRQWARTFTLRPVGAVDVALWDIAGKVAGLPLHRMLGGYRDAIPAYASSEKLGDPAAYAEQARARREAGWPGYKIHPPGTPAADIAACEAVRAAVGEGYPLMLDASFAYSFPEAMRVGRAIERLGFEWYEDPLGEQDLHNAARLAAKLDIPIMATELPMAGLESYAAWITARATDYLRGDVPMKGGVTTMIKTAHLAEAFGLNYEVHHGGNSVNNLAGLHVALAIRNTSWFEVLLPETGHRYGLEEEISLGPDGMVRAPEGPGLGARIDAALIARHRIAELR